MVPLSTNFYIKVVGGPYDGAYLSTRNDVTYEYHNPYNPIPSVIEGVITVTLDSSKPAVFKIDPSTQILRTIVNSREYIYATYGPDHNHQQISRQNSTTTPMLCKDLDGYLHCETLDDTLNVFAAEGLWTYLTSQSWQSKNSPEYVGVKYQIVYQPISVASSTTSSSTQPTSTLDAYDMITSKI